MNFMRQILESRWFEHLHYNSQLAKQRHNENVETISLPTCYFMDKSTQGILKLDLHGRHCDRWML